MIGTIDVEIPLDAIFAKGYLAAGVRPAVVAARSEAGAELVTRLGLLSRPSTKKSANNLNRWAEHEEQFLRDNYRFMPCSVLAKTLGRTETAVGLRIKKLGLIGVSKHPDDLTARGVARMLGIDEHAVSGWIESGILPARPMPSDYPLKIKLVNRVTFMRWAITPENWPLFKIGRIRDAKLKRLIKLRMKRWGDEWWTTLQVAEYHNVPRRNVQMQIDRGVLPSIRLTNYSGRRHGKPQAWGYRFVRKSDALAAKFYKGKGGNRKHVYKMPEALADYCIKAVGAGVPIVCVARMVGWHEDRITFWLHSRKGGGAAKQKFYDWRAVRMPCVQRAVQRFIAGRKLSYDEMLIIRGILAAWAKHHRCALRVPISGLLRLVTLRRAWMALQCMGVNPFVME